MNQEKTLEIIYKQLKKVYKDIDWILDFEEDPVSHFYKVRFSVRHIERIAYFNKQDIEDYEQSI